jgi:hypothetical protein
MVIKDSNRQPEKQQFPIEVTLFRIVIKDNHEQPGKRRFPIEITLF